MKVRAYVLLVSVGILVMSASTKKARLSEGNTPGNLAPRIESLENEREFSFQNRSGRYTLLNFWAAYDAESRALNIQLWNEVKKLSSSEIEMISISFDKSSSVFAETVKTDRLNEENQFRDGMGTESELYGKYALKKGFKNFLIDDQGVIVAVNVAPDEISNELSKN
ncbi:MAG: thioredoxin family protein [Parabacteroides sp.]|jgi:hypothetical protein|nr:thioredoxin family protein [Parabacteroides sp.]MBP8758537.1 thioredoxin family protein [Parabacteroides sp.]MBP9481268.1 thioredoxin family protein [Parabacteroides sp.]MBP9579902.1 thioredoxin family protein [Parabacteroides sp.]MDD2416645.1 thioredoxin-like domain-containing protein [Parabacteroides sp.]